MVDTREDVKKVVKKEKPNNDFSLDDFYKAMEKNQDVKDVALSNMVDTLFSDEKLFMIARLDKNLAYYMVKHIIIKNFFYTYYTDCSVGIEIKKTSEYPFYYVEYTQKIPKQQDLKGSYDEFMKRILQITISFEGKGREEIISIIKALREDIADEEISKGGLLKKLY